MNNKKQLLIFESIAHVAGGQRALLNLLPFLTKEFSVTVVLPKDGPLKGELDKLGVSVVFRNSGSYTLGSKNIFQVIKYIYFSLLLFLRIFLLIRKFDLIYVNSARWLPIVVMSDFWVSRPVIFHSHSLISDKKSLWLVEVFAGFKNVKKIIAASKSIVSAAAKLRDKTAVVYNGISSEIFYPATSRNKSDILEIGVVGDLIPSKGQDRLLMALASLNTRQWHLKIIGGSRPGNELFLEDLKRLVINLKIADQVDFIGRQEKVADYLRTLDVVVLPSTVPEGSSLAVIESLACGVPVIASDLGGTKELIVDGENGFIYKSGEENSLGFALNNFFRMSEDNRQTMGRASHLFFIEKYQIQDMAEKIIYCIKEVV